MTQPLPPAWLETTIDELFRTIGGGTPATGRSEFWGDGVPWITSADIDDAGEITPRKGVTPSGIASSATNPVPPGSVVVVTRVGLGKVGLAKQELCFSQDCQALLFNRELLNPSFVAHQMRRTVRGIRGRGTTIAGVTVKQLAALPFSLAPLPEQHRIVEAIESYRTRLDDAVASLKRTQTKLKAYRASVLKAALEGRLVPTEASLARAEKRVYEPGDVLLARILKERRRRWEGAELAKLKAAGKTPKDDTWKAKYQEPAAPDASTLPELPEGWCWTSLSALLSEPLRNGHSARKTNRSNGLRTLTLSAVTERDFGLHNTKLTVADPRKVRDLWLLPGDILIERANTPELVGSAAMFRGNADFAIFPDLLVRVRCTQLVHADYIEMILLAPMSRAHFQKAAQGIAGTMPKISQGTIETLPIPLPPAHEQSRLVLGVQRLFSIETTLLDQVAHDKLRSSHLRQSILSWAFEGKLVDQDPNDESAETLLATSNN